MNRRMFLASAGVVAEGLSAAHSFAEPALAGNVGGKTPTKGEGEIKTGGSRMIPVRGGRYRVWTKRVGHGDIKVLTLHGGPGVSHLYFECFEDFLPQAGIEFYYYDQLGSLFSDNPDDKSLWTVEGFTEEVEEVRQALGLENFYLYGHSWGGMLGYEYALKYGEHLKGLIISNMVASIPGYVKYVTRLRNELPPEVLNVMDKYEANSEFDAPEYQRILFEHVYAKHLCRLSPWPAPIDCAFKFLNAKVYNYMQGPNEFVVTGTFKDWDRTANLKDIKTPTLVMGARYDEMDPEEIKRDASRMPNARAVISDRGSHLAMYDDQGWYFRELIGFLRAMH